MTNKMRPAVNLWHAKGARADLVRAVLLGCEEECVPIRVTVAPEGDAASLAHAAASESALFVGAGIDTTDGVALDEQRLGERPSLLSETNATAQIARQFGIAAGRLVRGRPLPAAITNDDPAVS
jgi:hypothetical protein